MNQDSSKEFWSVGWDPCTVGGTLHRSTLAGGRSQQEARQDVAVGVGADSG